MIFNFALNLINLPKKNMNNGKKRDINQLSLLNHGNQFHTLRWDQMKIQLLLL